jgi:hypothetical protein
MKFIHIPITATQNPRVESEDPLLQEAMQGESFNSTALISPFEIEHMISGQDGGTTIYMRSGQVIVTDMDIMAIALQCAE